jgi:CRP-like cAMP-binding protein
MVCLAISLPNGKIVWRALCDLLLFGKLGLQKDLIMEKLLSLLGSIKPLSPGLTEYLRSKLQSIHFKKGKFLLRRGEVADRIFYIEKGLVRSYYVQGQKKISNWFMAEGKICMSVSSFLLQARSDDYLVALEDCETWSITYQELENIYDRFPEFEHHGRKITSDYYIWSEQRFQSILRKSPKQKLEHLLQTEPDLMNRANLRDLASYLNLSDRTFSRVREWHANRRPRKRRRKK